MPVSRELADDKLAARLPVHGDRDPYWRLAARSSSAIRRTPRAYFGDLKAWYARCALSGVHPLTTRCHHGDVWIRQLSREPQTAPGRPASPASIAKRLSCLSKVYDSAIKDVELVEQPRLPTCAGRRSPTTRGRSG